MSTTTRTVLAAVGLGLGLATIAAHQPAHAAETYRAHGDIRNQNGQLGLFLTVDRTHAGDWRIDSICASHSEARRVDGKRTALYVDGDRVWQRLGGDVAEGESGRCWPSVAGLLIDGSTSLTTSYTIVGGDTVTARLR
jgi:hypothetical protein